MNTDITPESTPTSEKLKIKIAVAAYSADGLKKFDDATIEVDLASTDIHDVVVAAVAAARQTTIDAAWKDFTPHTVKHGDT